MSIKILSKTCRNCGAPLASKTCPYCDTVYEAEKPKLASPRQAAVPKGLFEVVLGSSKYQVLGQVAQGAHSQVLLARTAKATTQQVLLKVSHDKDLLQREWATLRHLQHRCSYLDRLLPRPLKFGEVRGRAVLVTSWRSGFIRTLAFAKARYKQHFPAEAVIWIWNRVLDQLISLAELGYAHRNLCLDNILVHPRDHGVAFCGWSQAGLGPMMDLSDSGHCMAELLGKAAPNSLRELAASAAYFDSPNQLKDELRKVALAEFGPPRYVPFDL